MKSLLKFLSPSKTETKSFYSSINGVSFKNPDDMSRQYIIRKYAKVGKPLEFHHDKDNPYDQNAISVWMIKPHLQLGFLSQDLASQYAKRIDSGLILQGKITDITGGTEDKPTMGVNIQITNPK